MSFFSSPSALRHANFQTAGSGSGPASTFIDSAMVSITNSHTSHPAFGHLILLVFEAVLEVVCVSLPGYIIASRGMFDADMQKFVANLNVELFTPCLIFTKLASQLNASKLIDLAVIPVIFCIQTLVSYLCSITVARLFKFQKRPKNFVIAMGVFGNSNSLPISLVISLAQTLKGLHWDQIPGDNDDDVAARGILYLLIFQQLGQLLRWSWGYHVLLAPPEKFDGEDEHTNSQIEQGRARYRDDPDSADEQEDLLGSSSDDDESSGSPQTQSEETFVEQTGSGQASGHINRSRSELFESGQATPVTNHQYTSSMSSKKTSETDQGEAGPAPDIMATPANGNAGPSVESEGHFTIFPSLTSAPAIPDTEVVRRVKGIAARAKVMPGHAATEVSSRVSSSSSKVFHKLPESFQRSLTKFATLARRFFVGLWAFMNPPLWAMLAAIIVASVPSLQHLFFTEGTFIQNSVTRAVSQSGGVAVPLILVVLGANLARSTLPSQDSHRSIQDENLDKKLLIASIVSRMVLPTIIMAPMLALAAKYIPISILDDPIFVIVCFLLTGAPSALQLAQICQINGVYESVMSKLLFQSYVIWIMPSTLILVMCALEVVEWANNL